MLSCSCRKCEVKHDFYQVPTHLPIYLHVHPTYLLIYLVIYFVGIDFFVDFFQECLIYAECLEYFA